MHLTKGFRASLMSRRLAALSVLALGVLAALWALYETPYDGPWTGTNSESKAVSFTVSDDGTSWSSFSYAIEFVCSLTGSTVQTTITQSGPGAINEGTFSYSSSTLSFSGAFDTSTSASGTYTLTDYPVTHGVPPPYYVHTDYITLSSTWTATFSGEVPSITVTSPNGGESWDVGTSHDITWTSSGTVGDVMVEYSADSGSTWTTIAASTGNDGAEPWTVPNAPSATCLVRVSEIDGSPSDVSDAVFSIVAPPSITVTSPNGGEAWGIGSTYDITWSWTGDISNVMIEYSYTGGDSWEIIAGSTSNSGTYPWTIPEPASGSCMVRVSDAVDPGILDASDALFSTVTCIPAAERAALIALYNSTNGDSWTNNSGWKTPPLYTDGFAMPGTEGTWYGVTVDGGIQAVTSINLFSNSLSGSIPAALGDLTDLQELILQENQLSGSIPAELGNLSSLGLLAVGHNQLTGSIPPELGSLPNLWDLFLGDNQLSGSIPPELGALSNLTQLYLFENQLTGSIPPELGNLTNLEYLQLYSNQLTGSIPPELGSLTEMGFLELHTNQLTGPIPAEIWNLTNLHYLRLQNNQLTGSIPAEVGNLIGLHDASFANNQLSGSIPAELGALNLDYLTLNNNQLTGPIPPELGNLTNLWCLDLHGNQLSGAIPPSMVNLTELYWPYTNFGHNALYATDPDLIAFLNSKDSDWASTQTIAPEDVSATPLGGTTALVSWTPILYQGDAGGYIVSVSTDAGGPYTLVGQTADKSGSSMTVSGLAPGTPHYFVVRTHTDAHANNQNAVASEDSAEAQATTLAQLLVSGTVLSGGAPLEGVVMAGMPGEPATNASGMYQGLVDPGWSGTVTPALAGYAFAPPSYTYAAILSDQWNQNYEGTLVPASITVASPNGGEAWTAGSSQSVTWTATGLTGTVTIDLYKGGVYQKTLGTADAGDGAFIWAISAGEIPGTDYRVLVWQGSVLDESDGDFTILQAAATKRVDFNSDGQEDILWRYQGTGTYQGLVLAWLMNQTNPLMPLPQAPNEPAAAEESLLTAPLSGTATLNSEVTETLRTVEAKSHSRTIMEGREESIPEPRVSLRSALGIGRALPERELSRYLRDVPKMTDAVDLSAVGSGTTRIDSLKLGTEVIIARVQDTGWEIAGTGDFNSDGKVDILWRYYGPGTYQGLNVIWHMNGTSRINEVIFSRVSDTNWRIVGAGDFNSDGKTDILWRYYGPGTYEGLNIIWHMDGTTRLNEVVFSRVSDTAWKIAGTGDFDGDGKTDILWRHHGTGTYQGLNVIWHMDGTVRLNEVIFSRVTDTAWEIGGTGDFDSDGKVDILWRYYGPGTYQGLNVIWFMDGTTRLSEEIFSRVSDTNWRIVNR